MYQHDENRTMMEEMLTVQKRKLELELSDADVMRISEKAGMHGVTIAELLQGFISDLVDGTYSNGSDERRLAQEWFDRCEFNELMDNTFLRYLISCGEVYNVLDLWDDIQSNKKEIAYVEAHPDENSADEISDIQEDIDYLKEQIDDYWKEYTGQKIEYKCTLDEEIKKILEWRQEYRHLSSKSSAENEKGLHLSNGAIEGGIDHTQEQFYPVSFDTFYGCCLSNTEYVLQNGEKLSHYPIDWKYYVSYHRLADGTPTTPHIYEMVCDDDGFPLHFIRTDRQRLVNPYIPNGNEKWEITSSYTQSDDVRGYKLESGIILLDSERDIYGNYYLCIEDESGYKATDKLCIATKDSEGNITAFSPLIFPFREQECDWEL